MVLYFYSMKTRVLILLLLFIILSRVVVIFSKVKPLEINHEDLRGIWLHSQYNLNQGYEFFGNMKDDDLRQFSALEYINGKDPSVVNFEDPPLIKYFFGFSHKYFGNMIIAQFFGSIGIILTCYAIAKRLQLSPVVRLIPSLILIFDPLFMERSTGINLDIFQTLFSILAIFLLCAKKLSNRSLIVIGLLVGATMSSKVFFTGLLLMFYCFLILTFKIHKKLLYKLLIVVFSAFSVYLSSYLVFFLYNSINEFFLLHIKIIRLYRSYLPEYPWFEIWRIIFVGKWKTWFATPAIQPVKYFWLAWPIGTLLSFSLLLKKKIFLKPINSYVVLLGWLVLYLSFQSVHLVFPRYLTQILPIIYLLSTFQAINISGKITKSHKITLINIYQRLRSSIPLVYLELFSSRNGK